MDELLTNIEFDPVVSTIGVIAILLGIRLVVGAVRTALKLVFVGVILVGAYLFFYGGTVT